MRTLQVITDTNRRGAQIFAMDLGSTMRSKGHDVTTVALTGGDQTPALDVEVLGPRRLSTTTLRRLRSLMRAADVTIAHGSTTGPACALASGLGRRPFVYRQISDNRFWANTRRRRFRVGLVLRTAAGIVALSDVARDTLVDHVWAPVGRISVVPNGVPRGGFHPPSPAERNDARRRLGFAEEAFVAAYVGALVPEKGVADLLAAAIKNPDVSLVVAGDGPELCRLESEGASGAGDRIRFVGSVEDPMSIYAAADVVVLVSRGGDSMPASLIEAGFCGLPAVATPVGSMAEVVENGVTGLIIPIASVPELSDALNRLMTDEALRLRLGAQAEEHCLSRFEIAVVADQWIAVLSSLRGVAS